LLADVDALLAPRPELSLGKWVNDARAQGTTQAEKDLYELNARELVTLWGPIDNPSIFDYSWREWHGLIGSYYKVRWEKFLSYVSSRLKSGEGYSEEKLPQQYGREAWRANDFYRGLADWERSWVSTPAPIAKDPQGDAVALARGFLTKYRDAIAAGSPAGDAVDLAKLGKAVGEASPATVTTQSKVHQIDIAPYLDGDGRYAITFLYSSGRARLDIQSVELLANGQVIARDVHDGRTGNEHKENTYTLSLPEHAFGTSYQLRYSARTHGGSTDSTGTVYLRKLP